MVHCGSPRRRTTGIGITKVSLRSTNLSKKKRVKMNYLELFYACKAS
jgi:hypothetical protein